MKIHYLATSNIPSKTANSLQVVKMCEALSKIGHKISLIVPNLLCAKETVKNYYDLNNIFKLHKVGSKIKTIEGLDNLFIPILIVKKSFEIKSDLIITRNLFISFLLIFLKKKHIFEIHDDLASSSKFLAKVFKIFGLLNSLSILKIIFISNGLKKFIRIKYNYKKKNYDILPDGTDLFTSEKELRKSKKKLKRNKIGYFGSIYSSRGTPLIIELSKIDKNNDYYIYGGSITENAKLKKYTSNNLIIHPQITYKKVKKKILDMDILLMPYTKKATFSGDYGDIINFMSPMKMFDYLGAGKIIISSNIKVLREILVDNFNSLLINDFTEKEKWKIKIDKIKMNSEKMKRIRINALKTALKYNWVIRAKKMLK